MSGKIIIAEDNDDTREALRLSLEAEGYAVRGAANGDEAYQLQVSDPADLLVTDLFMPERDGFETLQLFRQNYPDTRIVVVSGSARKMRGNYLEAAEMVGADATLRKPVAPADLARLIAQVLGSA